MTAPDSLPQKSIRRSCWGWWLLLDAFLLFGLVFFGREKMAKLHEPLEGLRPIVARVDGRPIFARELISATQFSLRPPQPESLRAALERLIREDVIASVAEKTRVPEGVVEQRLGELRHQFSDEGKFASALENAGLTLPKLETRLRRHAQIEQWLLEQGRAEPDDAICQAWLASHPELTALPEVLEASHFVAIFPPRGTPADLVAKADLAREAQTQLAAGIPFSEVIENLSDDPAKKQTHGSLSWFRSGRFESALVESALKQPLNEVGPPIETRFGFHLLDVTARQPAKDLGPDGIAGEVRIRCQDEESRKRIGLIVTNLLQRAKVEILDPTLQKPLL